MNRPPERFRNWLLHGGLYTGAGVGLRGINLLLMPVATSLLSPAEYGTYDLVLVVVNWIFILVTLEASAGFTTIYCTAEEPRRPRIAGAVAGFALFGSILAALLLLPWSKPLAAVLLGDPGAATALALALAALPLYALSTVAQLQLRNAIRPLPAIRSQIVSALTSTLLGLFLAWWGLGVHGMLIGAIFGWTLGTATAWRACRDLWVPAIDRVELMAVLRFSAPLTIASIGLSVSQYAERFVIAHRLDHDLVGTYGVAARIAGLVGLALIGVQASLAPLVFTQSRDPAVRSRLAGMLVVTLAGSLVLLCWLSAWAEPLVHWLAAPTYAKAIELIPILAAAQLATQLIPFAPGPWLARQPWRLVGVSLAAGVASPLLALQLIPRMGVVGAAWANLAVAGSMIVVLLLISQRSFPVPHHWSRLVLLLALALAAMLAIAHADGLVLRTLLAAGVTVVIAGLGWAQLRDLMLRGVR